MKDKEMNVLVVGGGAREHTIVWKLKQSPRVKEIFVAPGNAGTAAIAKNLPIAPTDIAAQVKAVRKNKIDLIVVGPEDPLALGIVDTFQKIDIPIFGPTKAAVQLEASKIFSHELMEKYSIPCAKGKGFFTFAGAMDYLGRQKVPIVIKADGLVAGKGVTVAQTREEAKKALRGLMIERKLKEAGERVLVSECLTGKEVSAFAVTDSEAVVMMGGACDYKRMYDGDQGPMTGGMGGYSPPEFLSESLLKEIKEVIFVPVVRAMANEGRPYKGVLYGGLIITREGPQVLEFNVRFGDPETQVLVPRLKTDLMDIILAVLSGTLNEINIQFFRDACVGVVMASASYLGTPKINLPITGLNKLDPDILIFHAGTKPGEKPGEVLTSGGRVLTVVATGKTILEAQGKVYANVRRIHFEGCQSRGDIADKPIKSGFQLDMKGL